MIFNEGYETHEGVSTTEANMIREATEHDAEAIVSIYNHYVLNTTATFEERELSADQFAERIRGGFSSGFPWLKMERNKQIVGYTYASPWKTRSAYRFTVESSIFVEQTALGQGIGKALYDALLPDLRHRGIHAVVACLALPNPASVALHEKCGFQKTACFKEVGFKFGAWLDIGYWQLIL